MIPDLSAPPGALREPIGISILGSTGSIGRQTLEIARMMGPERLQVKALCARANVELLEQQARLFQPELVVVEQPEAARALGRALSGAGIRVAAGAEGLCEAAALPGAEVIVAAVVGAAGLLPVLAAIDAGKRVALANKETLVLGGAIVRRRCAATGAAVIPVDSEHSAIFQCLLGEPSSAVESLVLTASGGPFRTRPAATFVEITPAEALRHPNWAMGAKVTIDSATLMNKGLEMIEAHWLFGLEAARIRVLVHPQSIIHSMVAFVDGSTKAQLGAPDMRVPIQYALSWPARWPAAHPRIDWETVGPLAFEPPDAARFPALGLAYEALARGGAAPAVLNAANEEAVTLFLAGAIRFPDISRLVAAALEAAAPSAEAGSVEALLEADRAGRRFIAEHYRRAADSNVS